jgi:hypothetical protein
MDRRELLKKIAILTGGVVIGGEVFLSGCKTGADAGLGFSPSTIALLDEIGETIIPATNTPGAKAAAVGEFMKVMVTDCYTAAEQKVFMDGINSLQDVSKKMNGKDFMDCTPQQRHDLLVRLEKEAKQFNDKKNEAEKEQREIAKAAKQPFAGAPPHYYTMMKQLTLWGFFTSKTGMTETLRHEPVPGKYDGAFPYKKGDKAWAE